MNKEYATLIAQVIPVLVLALGLEVRAVSSRLTSWASGRDSDEQQLVSNGLFLLAVVVTFTLAVLVAVELQALSVVKGVRWDPTDVLFRGPVWRDDNAAENALDFSIMLVFTLPSFEVAIRLLNRERRRSLVSNLATVAILGIAQLVLVIGMAFLMTTGEAGTG